MAKYFAFALLALVAIQGSVFAKPAQPKTQLETMADNLKTIADNVGKTLGVQDLTSEKVLKTINDQAKVFADNLNVIKTQVDKEVKAHEGDVKKSLKEFEDRVSKTMEDIAKIVDPEKKVQKTAEEVRTKFETNFKSVAESFDNLAKKVQPQMQETGGKIEKLTKTIAENLTQVGKDLQTYLTKAVQEHQKTHKH